MSFVFACLCSVLDLTTYYTYLLTYIQRYIRVLYCVLPFCACLLASVCDVLVLAMYLGPPPPGRHSSPLINLMIPINRLYWVRFGVAFVSLFVLVLVLVFVFVFTCACFFILLLPTAYCLHRSGDSGPSVRAGSSRHLVMHAAVLAESPRPSSQASQAQKTSHLASQ